MNGVNVVNEVNGVNGEGGRKEKGERRKEKGGREEGREEGREGGREEGRKEEGRKEEGGRKEEWLMVYNFNVSKFLPKTLDVLVMVTNAVLSISLMMRVTRTLSERWAIIRSTSFSWRL